MASKRADGRTDGKGRRRAAGIQFNSIHSSTATTGRPSAVGLLLHTRHTGQTGHSGGRKGNHSCIYVFVIIDYLSIYYRVCLFCSDVANCVRELANQRSKFEQRALGGLALSEHGSAHAPIKQAASQPVVCWPTGRLDANENEDENANEIANANSNKRRRERERDRRRYQLAPSICRRPLVTLAFASTLCARCFLAVAVVLRELSPSIGKSANRRIQADCKRPLRLRLRLRLGSRPASRPLDRARGPSTCGQLRPICAAPRQPASPGRANLDLANGGPRGARTPPLRALSAISGGAAQTERRASARPNWLNRAQSSPEQRKAAQGSPTSPERKRASE